MVAFQAFLLAFSITLACSSPFPLEDEANKAKTTRNSQGNLKGNHSEEVLSMDTNRSKRSLKDNQISDPPKMSETNKPRIHLTPREPEGSFGGCFQNGSLDFSWEVYDGMPPVKMSMVHGDNFIQVPETGMYFVYAQLYYRFPPSKYGHCITKGYLAKGGLPKVKEYICTTDIVKKSRKRRDNFTGSQTKYAGGPVYLKEKEIIGIGVIKDIKAKERFIYLDRRMNYFGAYQL